MNDVIRVVLIILLADIYVTFLLSLGKNVKLRVNETRNVRIT